MALDVAVLTNRWGDIFGGINETNTFSGTTIASRANNISDEYTTLAGQGEVIDELYTQAINIRGDLAAWNTYLFGLVETTLQTMCRDDSARPRTDDLAGWFDKLNRDMVGAGSTFTRPGVAATVAVPGTNIGDGYLIASVVEPVDGKDCYYAYSEVVRLECTTDSYSGTATAGGESFAVYGETAVGLRDYNWPKGSGVETTLAVVNPDTSAEVEDGAFDDWTATNTPTNWSLLTGTVAGTHVFQEADTAEVYATGSKAVRFEGDGSTAGLGVYQELDQTVVRADTNYAVSVWYRSGATSAVTGADLRIALTNGSGTVVTDNNSVSQSATITNTNFTDADATWTRKTCVLRTPRSLPTELRLELKFTGTLIDDAGDDAKKVWVDHLTMSPMVQLYDGGPYLALHGGNTPFALRDAFTGTVATTYTGTGAASTTSWVRVLDRTFSLAENGIRLTVAAGTIGSAQAGTYVDGTTLIV